MRHFNTVLALTIASASAFAGPMLVNGDLELPFNPATPDDIVGWTLLETSEAFGPVNSATFASFGNHTPGGDRGLWLRSFEGDVAGAPVNATLYQDVAAIAGAEYTLSAWFRAEANYTSQTTTLGIQFLDAAMMELSSTTIDLNALSPRDSVWREFSVNAVGVAGTAFLRVSAEMTNGQQSKMNPQSAFFDDFTLVPAPSAAAILAFGALITGRRRR